MGLYLRVRFQNCSLYPDSNYYIVWSFTDSKEVIHASPTLRLDNGLNVALNKHSGRDLPASVVKQYAEYALKGRGILTYSGHVKQRMREREFSTQDVQHVLETGTYSKGFWTAQEQNHEFNVKGHDLNGEELEISCAVISPVAIKVVTGKRLKI